MLHATIWSIIVSSAVRLHSLGRRMLWFLLFHSS